MGSQKRFSFIDGLSGLFTSNQKTVPVKTGQSILTKSDITSVSGEVLRVIRSLNGDAASKVLLVVDQLDLLLAAGGDQVNSINIGEMLMDWREVRKQQLHSVGT